MPLLLYRSLYLPKKQLILSRRECACMDERKREQSNALEEKISLLVSREAASLAVIRKQEAQLQSLCAHVEAPSAAACGSRAVLPPRSCTPLQSPASGTPDVYHMSPSTPVESFSMPRKATTRIFSAECILEGLTPFVARGRLN